MTVTLDDVSHRIDKICTDYIAQAVKVKTTYADALDALANELKTSPDINQDVAITIVFRRVQSMLAEAAKVLA